MSTINPLKLLGLVDALLVPIHKVIELILPDYLERDLKDPDVREEIVLVADKLLVKRYPQAKLVPKETRQKVIRKTLDLILDDLLLPDEE